MGLAGLRALANWWSCWALSRPSANQAPRERASGRASAARVTGPRSYSSAGGSRRANGQQRGAVSHGALSQ